MRGGQDNAICFLEAQKDGTVVTADPEVAEERSSASDKTSLDDQLLAILSSSRRHPVGSTKVHVIAQSIAALFGGLKVEWSASFFTKVWL